MANALTLRAYVNTGSGAAWRDVATGEKLLFQKSGDFAYGATGAITVGEYNGGTHVISAANEDICTTTHQPNLEYSTDTGHYKLNGGSETALDATHPATTECLNIHVTCSPNAALTAASVFVYGTGEAEAPAGLTIYGVLQGAVSPVWASVAGSAAALNLGTATSAATHDKYFGLTLTPTANGSLTGTLKASVTVV